MSFPPPATHSCCTCGYTWKHGHHGGHNCSVLLLEKIEKLESQLRERDEAMSKLHKSLENDAKF